MERLQKVLAQAGLASRRAAEQIILAGRVRVDGKVVTELGTQVDPRKNRVEVDGKKIVAENLVYIVLHKPRGVVCTLSDPEGRPTIRELLKEAGGRVVPVGRLDFHTSGALLCTNDGEFSQALAHPKRAVPKVYVAKVKGTVDDDALPKFSESIEIDGRATQPAQVRRLRYEGDKTWLEITLREGRNRQVRRLGEATGFPVMRLARISHAGVTSEDLRPGQWRPLTVDELVDLKKTYGVPKKVRSAQLEPLKGKEAKSRMRARPDVRGEVHSRTKSAERDAAKRGAPVRGDERLSISARSEGKSSRFDRTEKPSRFTGAEAKPSRFDRTEKPSRFGRAEAKPSRFDRTEKPSRFGRAEAKPSRFDRTEKPSRFGSAAAKPARFERADARPERASRADKKPARPERAEPPRGATTRKAPRDGRASSPRRGTSR